MVPSERFIEPLDVREDTRPSRTLVVFVHGFGSSPQCWDRLLALLRVDERLTETFEFATFTYATKWFELNVLLRRIPDLSEIAEKLEAKLDHTTLAPYSGVTLVGHSQGGLVILQYLTALLKADRAPELAKIRSVLLLGTPLLGSKIFSALRWLIFKLFANPQERSLRLLSEDIDGLRRETRQRIANARPDPGEKSRLPIRIHAFWGLQDRIVSEQSAREIFESASPLDGDHFSMLTPADKTDDRYRQIVDKLLSPPGHPNVFEVERFTTLIEVRWSRQPQVTALQYPKSRKSITTSDVVHVRQDVTFATTNRCVDLFDLWYRTLGDGYIEATPSDVNQAASERQDAYAIHGKEFVFSFRPAAAERYALLTDVYGGFGPEHQNWHAHLKSHSWCRAYEYTVDFRPAIAAGYAVLRPPQLHFHDHEPANHDLCAGRQLAAAVPPLLGGGEGVWQWRIEGQRRGVVDIVWKVGVRPS